MPARRCFLVPAALALLVSMGGCGDARLSAESTTRPATHISEPFPGPDGLEFDAVVERPAEAHRNGWGVLLIGGGLGNDLDWTAPGQVDFGDGVTQVTITGEPHADAPRISAALVSRGFTVMRWSTIARGDPLADQWPVRTTPRTLAELADQTRAALTALRRQPTVRPDRVILLGFSLGAARACTIAAEDEGVRALILLSPAYFTRPSKPPASFEAGGMLFGAETLQARPLPALLVFGELDVSGAVDLTGAEAIHRAAVLPGITIRSMPDLGHQLGPQQGALLGPIDERVTRLIAEWAANAVIDPGGAR